MLVLPEGLLIPAEGAERADQRGVSLFAERVDHRPAARVNERGIGRAEEIDEARQHRDVKLPKALALSGEPLLKAIAGGKIETIEKLSANALRRAVQVID